MSEVINFSNKKNDASLITPSWMIENFTQDDLNEIGRYSKGIFILLETGKDGSRWRTQFFNASMRKSEIIALLQTVITALSMDLNGDRDY